MEDKTGGTEGACVELNKSQKLYKRSFDNRIRRGIADITAGYYVWLDVHDGNEKNNLGGHTGAVHGS